MIELVAQIDRITFANEENGYTVARASVEGEREPVMVVGILADAAPGVVYTMQGDWTVHPKFGRQFKVLSAASRAPQTAEAVERYLAAGPIRGIGPATAKRIVRAFGAQALDIMEKDIGRLKEISGIGRKRLDEITASWKAQAGVRDVMIYLQGHGISPALAGRIVGRYGARAKEIVSENPYRLADEVKGIGFATADRIAMAVGFPKDSPERFDAGVLHVMELAGEQGNVYVPVNELVARAGELLGEGAESPRRSVERLCAAGRLSAEPAPEAGAALDEAAALYVPRLYRAEVDIAERLEALVRRAGHGGKEADAAIASAVRSLHLELAPLQLEALRSAVVRPVTVITGGPGTGKTTIIDAVVRVFERLERSVLLAAPTGRAAKRMGEATGREARTIHRLLEIDPVGGGFKRGRDDPLDCDALIVDEISMVDTLLMSALLSALAPGSTLVLVGDSDQLPSVGPGNVLGDIIESGCLPTVRLNAIFRQSRDSMIVDAAHAILAGREPAFAQEEEGDLFFIEQGDPERVASLIVTLVKERIPRRFGLDAFSDIQVLSPMNRGVVGTAGLNTLLQDALNPERGGAAATLRRGAKSFRAGDRVMQTRNDYGRDVFNGDIGIVRKIESEELTLDVDFDGRRVHYEADELDDLVLAYAVTVHKAQGSEFPCVVIPLLAQHYVMLQRNLLYTAVTRGKRLVVVVGTGAALSIALRNDRTQRRHTSLDRRLRSRISDNS